jgi:hypothetical protein
MLQVHRRHHRSWLNARSLVIGFVALAAGGPVAAGPLHPLRVLRDTSLGPTWNCIARADALPGWLIGRGGEVLTLKDGATSTMRLTAPYSEGGALFSALVIGVSPERAMVLDAENGHLVEVDAVTGKVKRATPLDKLDGSPVAGIAWNGTAWVLAGDFRFTPTQDVVQIREPQELRLVAKHSVPPADRHRLNQVGEGGAVASGPAGKTLVVLVGLLRAFVIDGEGRENVSLELPIPNGRRLSLENRSSPPKSTDELWSLYRGRTLPVAAGWSGEDPSVLLAALDSGDAALTWCRFSQRDGALKATYVLDVPSAGPHDFFQAASRNTAQGTTLMVLKTTGSNTPGRRGAFLFEFLIPSK